MTTITRREALSTVAIIGTTAFGRSHLARAATLDVTKFIHNIGGMLNATTVGWGAVVYNGTTQVASSAGGYQILSPPNSTAMTPKTRLSVRSMSKTITAAALVTQLPWKKLSVDSLIDPYLPGRWKRGPNVNQLTFRM